MRDHRPAPAGSGKPGADDLDDVGERDRVGGVPGNTRTATGRPSGSVSTPYSIGAGLFCRRGSSRARPARSTGGHRGAGQIEQRHPRRVHVEGKVFGGELVRSRPADRRASPSQRRLVGGRAGQVRSSRACYRPRRQGGQLRGGPHDPGDDQHQRQIAGPARRTQQRGQAQLVRHSGDRGDVPVRQRRVMVNSRPAGDSGWPFSVA